MNNNLESAPMRFLDRLRYPKVYSDGLNSRDDDQNGHRGGLFLFNLGGPRGRVEFIGRRVIQLCDIVNQSIPKHDARDSNRGRGRIAHLSKALNRDARSTRLGDISGWQMNKDLVAPKQRRRSTALVVLHGY